MKRIHTLEIIALTLAFTLQSVSAKESPNPHVAAKGATPWVALNELKDGNKRFTEGRSTHSKQDPKTRAELASGQKPHTIVLSCSDSRVPPELVFDQGLGQLFVVRTAGEVVASPVIASIEYAVEHLGAKLILVMGHESCGAVKAAIDTPAGKSAGSSDLDQLVGAIRPAIEGHRGNLDDKTLREPVKANVVAVAHELISKSKILKDAQAKGEIMIAEAIYSLSSGKVEFWEVGEFGAGAH